MIKSALVALALFAAVSPAAANAGTVVTSVDGRQAFQTDAKPKPHVPNALVLEPGETAIFDNLAEVYPDGTYNCCASWVVSGPGVPFLGQSWVGAAFTPANDATVTKLELALDFNSGPNALTVTLNSDNNGVPGAVLATMTAKNLPPSGSCCTVTSLKVKDGVALTGGTQYWVVVATSTKDSSTWAGWNDNVTEQINPLTGAVNRGSGWVPGAYLPGMAFAVVGPK